MSQTQVTALSLFTHPSLKPAGDALSRLQAQAVADLQQIQSAERRTAADAVRLGIRLHAIKLGLPPKTWTAWQEENIKGIGRRQVNNYMRLAAVAGHKIGRKALIAIVSGHDDQDTTERIERFVGECSLTELLIKFGIRAVGLRGELQEPAAGSLSPDRQLELDMQRTWEESWASLQRVRGILTDADRIKLISDPTKLATLKSELLDLQRVVDSCLHATAVAV